jgi:hypothetical protein
LKDVRKKETKGKKIKFDQFPPHYFSSGRGQKWGAQSTVSGLYLEI